MIKRDVIEKVKDIDIYNVVSKHVALTKKGPNFSGLCPFHDEKTPSFLVSPNKGIYKCFGCGKSGDIIRFVEEFNSLAFADAVRQICDEFNITVEEDLSDEDKSKVALRESIYRVNQLVCEAFEEELHTTDNKSMSLFEDRGFSQDTMFKFCLGHAPGGYDFTLNLLNSQGISEELMLSTNLVKKKHDRKYDFFVNRSIFPIHNKVGKVVGFGGRIIDQSDKKSPKYLNSPDSEVYNKSKELYGYYFAKQAISKLNNCIFVEGYTDVISMHQNSFENTVSVSGTSLTVDQARLVKRITSNVIVLMDGDKAGLKASFRSVDIFLSENMSCKLAILEDGNDPDSFIRDNGRDAMESLLSSAKDAIIYKFELLKREHDGGGPDKDAMIAKDIMASIKLIPDTIRRAVYIKEISKLIGISEKALDSGNYPSIKQSVDTSGIEITTEHDVIRALFSYGDKDMDDQSSVRDFILRECPDDMFSDDKVRGLMKTISTDNSSMQVIKMCSDDYRDFINEIMASSIMVQHDRYKLDVEHVVIRLHILKSDQIISELINKMEGAGDTKKVEIQKKLANIRRMKSKYITRLNKLY